MNAFDELNWRGMIHTSTEGVEELLVKQKISAYIGFDPTASSLHVGSLLPIMALMLIQQYGHTPIVVVGGGTGLIGDPSGKSNERPLLSEEIVKENIEGIKKQLASFLDFETKTNPAIIVNNADWLNTISLSDFLRKVGKYFTINYMMDKESIKRRLNSEEGISFTEFTYMLTQSYDYLMLYEKYNCLLQMGGSDQWGNITAGIDLIRKQKAIKAHGLVFPLITSSSGEKFGKTELGTIWLSPDKTSPYKFYQFWLNTSDSDVISYLKFFTRFTKSEIHELELSLLTSPEKREAQKTLAKYVTRLVHGDDGLNKAITASNILFGEEIHQLETHEILDIFDNVPSTEIKKSIISSNGINILELVAMCNFTTSKSETRRLIKNKGLYLNNKRLEDENKMLFLSDAINCKFFVLRKGSKQYHLVKII